MTRILVIGGSSGTGAGVVKRATEAGHSVRAMSRSGSVPDDVEGDCEGFTGNAREEEDTRRALNDIDIVVQTLGVPVSLKLITHPVTLFSETTRVLLPLMKQAGISRLISVTGFGAGDSHSSINCLQRLPFRIFLKNAYDDKTIQEDLITSSDLNWLVVRPGVLTPGDRTGKYNVLMDQKAWRNGLISRADVADFIVSQAGPDGLSREKPVLIRYPL